MDPRHPELAISRLRELMYQYNEIENGMKHATTSAQLAQLEHEGALVVQEICLVAPRIHEAMMQTSRQRRYELSHGIAFSYIPEEKVGKYIKSTIGIEKKPVEKPVHKWSSAEKVAKAKEYLEQTIANSDVEKPASEPEKSPEKPAQSVIEQPAESAQSVKKTEVKPKKKTTKKKTTKETEK